MRLFTQRKRDIPNNLPPLHSTVDIIEGTYKGYFGEVVKYTHQKAAIKLNYEGRAPWAKSHEDNGKPVLIYQTSIVPRAVANRSYSYGNLNGPVVKDDEAMVAFVVGLCGILGLDYNGLLLFLEKAIDTVVELKHSSDPASPTGTVVTA